VVTVLNPLRTLAFALALSTLGCHAQTPALKPPAAAGAKTEAIAPDVARRIEVLIRSKSNVPPNYVIAISTPKKSDFAGFGEITVTFTADGETSRPITFLLSDDNKTLMQLSRFDISQDPRNLVPAGGRPARGGPADAPVLIVGFDDLECPYCAKMHAALFPAILERYKDQVHIVYKDFPLEQHPWAIHAAVDANCLGAQNPKGYWNLVDYIHAHAADFGGPDHTLAKATESLDTLTKEEGQRVGAKADTLAACIAKQDDSAVTASRKEGETLGVSATPALYINGERVEGAIPIEYIYRIIDQALVAAGQTPPPPVPIPPIPQAAKPGN
jgi:protein-disulfide isomerase